MQIKKEKHDVLITLPVEQVHECTQAIIHAMQVAALHPDDNAMTPNQTYWLMEILSQLQLSARQTDCIYDHANADAFPLS